MCGKTIEGCPGQTLDEKEAPVDCMVCLKAIETREKAQRMAAKWQIESQQRAIERARQNAEWWAWYNAYLLTPEWKRKRDLVMRRANRVCEGCGINSAIQVHHLTYEHVGNELLFELVAICHECHQIVHPEIQDVS